MDLRYALVRDYLAEWASMTELCQTYGVSRKTAYKWCRRFDEEGRAGLTDRSRRPHTIQMRVTPSMRAAVLETRRRYPDWGARKIRRWLRNRDGRCAWPARSTIHEVCQAAGLVRVVRRRIPALVTAPHRLRPADAPNAVWTVDFKGHFRLGLGARCYPLTVRDLASRFTLRCDALAGERTADTRARFERAFATYGLPACIRSDNGKPFAGPGLARLSVLNVWWLRLGIAVEHIALGRPTRMDRTSNSIASSKRGPRVRQRRPSPRSSGASIGSGASTTSNARMRRSAMTYRPRTTARRPDPIRRACRRSSIPVIGNRVACGPGASSPGPTHRSFSVKR